jgi:type IV pilus assembly protein PilV
MKPTNSRKVLPAPRQRRSAQGGVMLLEALLGLLIFSLGILALVAMQAVSISNVSNAKYRVEAALATEEILNYMWMSDPTPATLKLAYGYPGGNSAYLMNWVTRLQGSTGLPGAGNYPPTIVIDALNSIGPDGLPCVVIPPAIYPAQCSTPVTVTIRWKAPDALAPSNHTTMSYITTP